MSSFVSWVKRHRRKLVLSGAVIGGLYLVGKIAERQMAKMQVRLPTCFLTFKEINFAKTGNCFICQEEETRRILEAARKQNHFASTENTAHRTLAALFPALRQVIGEKLETDTITNILRQRPPTEDKIQFWTELKVISVSRCVVLVLSGVYLCKKHDWLRNNSSNLQHCSRCHVESPAQHPGRIFVWSTSIFHCRYIQY